MSPPETGEVLYVQMQQPAWLKIKSSWWLSHSFSPWAGQSLFIPLLYWRWDFGANIEGKFFHQRAQFIHIRMGFQVFASEISSHSMLLYNRTRDNIFWTSYYANIIFSPRCTWNLPPFKILDYWITEGSIRPYNFNRNVLTKNSI